MTEKISIIIPIWKPNLNEFKQSIESIISQTYNNLEVLLIHRKSESDDDFYSLMANYRADKRIRVISSKTRGFVNALNEGIAESTGDLIGRIDGDDYCSSYRFEEQLNYKKKHGLHIVGTWAYRISSDGRTIGKVEPPITHDEIRRKMMFHCPMLHPTILMDKKMLNKIGNYDDSFIHAEDYELFFKAMHFGYKFGNVPKHLVYIRESPVSRSRGSEWKIQRQYYRMAKNKAFREYGFNNSLDILFHMLTPISYFMSPKIWEKTKKITGWSK